MSFVGPVRIQTGPFSISNGWSSTTSLLANPQLQFWVLSRNPSSEHDHSPHLPTSNIRLHREALSRSKSNLHSCALSSRDSSEINSKRDFFFFTVPITSYVACLHILKFLIYLGRELLQLVIKLLRNLANQAYSVSCAYSKQIIVIKLHSFLISYLRLLKVVFFSSKFLVCKLLIFLKIPLSMVANKITKKLQIRIR